MNSCTKWYIYKTFPQPWPKDYNKMLVGKILSSSAGHISKEEQVSEPPDRWPQRLGDKRGNTNEGKSRIQQKQIQRSAPRPIITPNPDA